MSDIAGAPKEKHEFALYRESLSSLVNKKDVGSDLLFADEKLLHRMMTVLRLQIGDKVVLFDRQVSITAEIAAYLGKKQVRVIVQAIQQTTVLHPKVTFLLPVLKRDDFESALYSLAEIGVNDIQLVFTQKTGNQWSGNRDSERIQRIIIAAAEQSKNFAYPQVKAPISLQAALKENSETAITKIFFDPMGKKLFDVMETLHNNKPSHVLLLIGPEGDLSLEEKKMVQANDFIFCALTPTIVRAVQAAALAAGFVRSLLVSASF